MYLFPAGFETEFGFVPGFEKGWSRDFPQKNPKIDEVIEGQIFLHFGL
jgi:hypothetical protein